MTQADVVAIEKMSVGCAGHNVRGESDDVIETVQYRLQWYVL